MKYLSSLILVFVLSNGLMNAQEKEGFFGKLKDSFSSEIVIGTYTFKDGAVYSGEMNKRKPNGKGKTIFKNGDVYEGEYVKGKRKGYGTYSFTDGRVCL